MTKIDIISGFLGAGKTTLIKKLLEEKAFTKDRLVLIENEFGEIGIDGAILKGYGIEIKEMNSGCICCTIAGDFSQALKEMMKRYRPDRIIIEPSGVGKLSDVIKGCRQFVMEKTVELNICLTVVDGMKYKMYMKNFGEFYKDQLVNAKTIILSRTQCMKQDAIEYVLDDIKKYNRSAPLIITDWELLAGGEIVKLSENTEQYSLESSMLNELKALVKTSERSYKIADKRISGSIRKEHHHADDVFSVWSKETARIIDYRQLKEALNNLDMLDGLVLRAKGIVRTDKNKWVQFDYVPGESSIKETSTDFTGRICVIGEHINDLELSRLFGI
jgi:G3E family GTPase